MNNFLLQIKASSIQMRMEDSAKSDLTLYIDYNVATHQYYDSLMTLLDYDHDMYDIY